MCSQIKKLIKAENRRFRLYRREGGCGQPGIFGDMTCVERGRRALGKSKVKATEK